jgi:hypothetical protein
MLHSDWRALTFINAVAAHLWPDSISEWRAYGPNMATRDPNEFFTVAQKPGAHAIRAIISPPAQGEYPCCDAQSMSQMGQIRPC